jgi:hypothetical protein
MFEIDARLLRLIDLLIYHKKTKNAAEFCSSIKLAHSTLNNIKIGKQHFTLKHVSEISKLYNVDLNWIFGFKNTVYKNDETTVLTSV